MKKIISCLILVSMLVSCFVPVYADTGEYVCVSENKPITSIFYGDGGYSGNIAANANDGNSTSLFYSRAGANVEEGLIIDLEESYKIAYSEVSFSGSVAEYSIVAANNADFSDAVTLTLERSKFYLPEAEAERSFRYVKLDIPDSVAQFRVRELTVYVTQGEYQRVEQSKGEIFAPSEFQDEIVPVSVNKPILSKLYGAGGFTWEGFMHKASLANDGDLNTNFINATATEDWLRIDLEAEIKIEKVSVVLEQYKGQSRVVVSNDEKEFNSQFDEYVELILGADGNYYLPEGYENERFRFVQLEKIEDPSITSIYVREITVYASASESTYIASLNKPAYADGQGNAVLTDGSIEATCVFEEAIIDLLTPTYISRVEVDGASDAKVYGSLLNTEKENFEEISSGAGKKYRYILVDNTQGEEISEVKVYGYYSDNLSLWSYDKEKNEYTVSVENKGVSGERSYSAVVTLLDDNGGIVSTRVETALVSGGAKQDFVFNFGEENHSGAVCQILADGKIALTNPTFFKQGERTIFAEKSDVSSLAQRDKSKILSYAEKNNGIEFELSDAIDIYNSDILTYIVTNPSGEIVEVFSDYATKGKKYSYYNSPENEGGEYKISIMLTDAECKTYSRTLTFSYVPPTEEEINDAISMFKNTDGTDFAQIYNDLCVEQGIINLRGIYELQDADVLNRIGTTFAYARDNISKLSSEITEINVKEDIEKCIKLAIVLDSVTSGENTQAVLGKYSQEFDKIFDDTLDVSKFVSVYNFTDTDLEKVIKNMVLCNALSKIKGGKVTEIANALEKYSTVLSVDLNKINNSGIDILEIARKVDNSIPEGYYNGLAEEITAWISALSNNAGGGAGGGGGSGGGGGGGGGGNSSSSSKTSPSIVVPFKPGYTEEEETEADTKVSFSDVPVSHWASKSIIKLQELNIVSGYEDNTFNPDKLVNRAEFITMVVGAFDLKTDKKVKLTFDDCNANEWYYPYIDAAISNKIASGKSASEFGAKEMITRQDASVILSNILSYYNYSSVPGKIMNFYDEGEIGNYAKDAVSELSNIGVINGFEDGTFRPKESLSRAQAAVMLDGMLGILKSKMEVK